MRRIIFILFVLSVGLTSCVSKKHLLEAQNELEMLKKKCNEQKDMLTTENDDLKSKISTLQDEVKEKGRQVKTEADKSKRMSEEIDYLKKTNTNLLGRMEELSIISKTGAESIKKSLESMDRQNRYIQDLNNTVRRKDSLNMALANKIKRSLGNVSDTDVNVEVKKGVVYISISDKLLFNSGSSRLNTAAKSVLSKIAMVVNDHRDFDILVEGHTDDDPIASGCNKDNWDLSVMRATAVVRSLQKDHNVDPARMTAGGRSEYLPKASNETKEGKAMNRRTEIIVLPDLEEYFKLMNSK